MIQVLGEECSLFKLSRLVAGGIGSLVPDVLVFFIVCQRIGGSNWHNLLMNLAERKVDNSCAGTGSCFKAPSHLGVCHALMPQCKVMYPVCM